MGADGKPYKTREGTAAGLESLLDEAVSRAAIIVAENDEENVFRRKNDAKSLKSWGLAA